MENSSQQTYTVGIWNVKPGKEEEFIKHWTDFATWAAEKINDTGSGRLLQDIQNPTKFFSFGIWENPQKVEEMRSQNEFKTFAEKTKELVAEFTLPQTMKLVSKVGK